MPESPVTFPAPARAGRGARDAAIPRLSPAPFPRPSLGKDSPPSLARLRLARNPTAAL